MGREHDGLPERALVALGVADQHEHAPRRALEAGRERGAGAERQPVTERAGREVDAGERCAPGGTLSSLPSPQKSSSSWSDMRPIALSAA